LSSKLSDLAQAHLAVMALLDSSLISSATRRQLEAFRDQLERDIAELKEKESGNVAAD
jgi:hypothetical protein